MSNSRKRRVRVGASQSKLSNIEGLLSELNDAQSALNSMQASLAQTVDSFAGPVPATNEYNESLPEILAQLADFPEDLTDRAERLRAESFSGTDRDRTVRLVLGESCTEMDLILDADALVGVPVHEIGRRIVEAHAGAASAYRQSYQQTQDWTNEQSAPLRRYAEAVESYDPTGSCPPGY